MPRVNYRSSDVALMARLMRAEAEGEGKQGMLYVGNVIVNRVVAECLDFKGLRTVEQVIFQVQGGNFSFEAVQKGNVFYQRARTSEKRLAKKIWIIGENTQQNMLFGILILMVHALQHGMVNLILVNLKNIVFMNQNLEHVMMFIEVKLTL